jgi:Bacterial inner membrane protein
MIIDLTDPAMIFGFAGVLANFCWPMMRKRTYLLAGQVIACCFMFAHFALLGAYTGAAIMGVAGFQAALAIPLGKNPKFKLIYLASLLLTPVVCYTTWQGVQSVFSSLALAIVCIANFQLNEVHQRALLITAIFAWFAHNLVIGSVPGIVSNALAFAISSRMLFIAAQNKRE